MDLRSLYEDPAPSRATEDRAYARQLLDHPDNLEALLYWVRP